MSVMNVSREETLKLAKAAGYRTGCLVVRGQITECVVEGNAIDATESAANLIFLARNTMKSEPPPGRAHAVPTNTTRCHELKTDPEAFQAVRQRLKTAEIRYDDRGYQVGDVLLLRETQFTGAQMAEGEPLVYTGASELVSITHILRGPIYGLAKGWAILSFRHMGDASLAPEACHRAEG